MYSDISPAHTDCTCGYFNHPATTGLSSHGKTDLTVQIGSLLIALGNMFETAPLFKTYINPNTAKLLVTVGNKLLKSTRNQSRVM